MKRIGLLSDTHGYLDERIFKYFAEVDEIWHAGDIGDLSVTDKLAEFKPLRAVYGNIDGATARRQFPEHRLFEIAGLRVLMTHIGGFPGRYPSAIAEKIKQIRPKLFICGHSHIVRIMPDKKWDLLHINPGAAGIYGFHQVRTLVRFGIKSGKVVDLQLIELGPRSSAQFVERGVETT